MPSCDQTGVPLYFHSSTTCGSAFLMNSRILPSVLPRQSPSSAIFCAMSSVVEGPWPADDGDDVLTMAFLVGGMIAICTPAL